MRTARAEREEAARVIASARAEADAGDTGHSDDDLDCVDADEDAEYEAFLEELYSPSELPFNKFLVGYPVTSIVCVYVLLTCGRHLPTVFPTVEDLLRSLR